MATSTSQPSLSKVPGIALAFVVSLVAYWLGNLVPLIGGSVFGILLGLAVGLFWRPPALFKAGLGYSAKQVLQIAIVLIGFSLPLGQVVTTGRQSLAVMLTTLAACLAGAWLLGRALGVGGNLTALIGAGTAICGASAIAAVAPVVEAEEKEMAYAISTVFAFNIVAVLLFPALGHLMNFSQHAFGLWAGTAINDTSSVVAAAMAYGKEAGAYATIVKLSRATMIIPITLVLAAWRSFAAGKSAGVKWTKIVPWFILWFLAASVVRSAGWLPAVAVTWLPWLGRYLITVALAAVGLNADVKAIAKSGWRPLALGAMLWVLVAVTSIVVQRLTGQA